MEASKGTAMSRILLTGGSGFLGCYVLRRLLQRGDTVVNFDIRPPSGELQWLLGEDGAKVSFERGRIEDLPTLISVVQKHQIEKIVHAAAVVDPPLLQSQPIMAYKVNIGGTLNVLEAARILHVPKVVFISSNGVFTSKRYEPIDEEHPVLLPNEGPGNGPYSISKVASEAFGMHYAELFDFDFISLRPSAIYGFGMQYPMYVKPMVENSVRGEATRFETGRDFPRDYTYVEDVASAVVLALDVSSHEDRIFLIATGEPLSTPGQIAELLRRFIPGCDIEVGPGLTEWNKREIQYRGQINIDRARKQLGYEPEYDLETGLRSFIEIYRNYIRQIS
jgi:nucleoside-diphosphate-sugar epimerase